MRGTSSGRVVLIDVRNHAHAERDSSARHSNRYGYLRADANGDGKCGPERRVDGPASKLHPRFQDDRILGTHRRPIGDIRRRWNIALEAAGLPRGSKLFHDLRRSGVRDMIRAGVPQSVAMSISGHKTVLMFVRYNITSDADQRDALRRVEQHLQAQGAAGNVVAFKNRPK